MCYFSNMAANQPTKARQACDEVLTLLEDGLSLRAASHQCGITPQLFNHYKRGDKDLAVAYARAMEARADLLADEAIEIADNESDSSKARNQIDVRKWAASKFNPKRYGERIDMNVTQSLDITGALEEARARLLSMRDQSNIIDAQAIDISNQTAIASTDCKSEEPKE